MQRERASREASDSPFCSPLGGPDPGFPRSPAGFPRGSDPPKPPGARDVGGEVPDPLLLGPGGSSGGVLRLLPRKIERRRGRSAAGGAARARRSLHFGGRSSRARKSLERADPARLAAGLQRPGSGAVRGSRGPLTAGGPRVSPRL